MKTPLRSAGLKPACSGLVIWLLFPALLCSAELKVGAASVDITPHKAVFTQTKGVQNRGNHHEQRHDSPLSA